MNSASSDCLTSTAYTHLRARFPSACKVDKVVRRAGFHPDGHLGKALVNVLEMYPRDELFQIDDDQLYDFAQAIFISMSVRASAC